MRPLVIYLDPEKRIPNYPNDPNTRPDNTKNSAFDGKEEERWSRKKKGEEKKKSILIFFGASVVQPTYRRRCLSSSFHENQKKKKKKKPIVREEKRKRREKQKGKTKTKNSLFPMGSDISAFIGCFFWTFAERAIRLIESCYLLFIFPSLFLVSLFDFSFFFLFFSFLFPWY